MKKNRLQLIIIGILTISIIVRICDISTVAAQEPGNEQGYIVSVSSNNNESVSVSMGDAKHKEEMNTDLSVAEQTLMSLDRESVEVINLQVPSNLNFVIDPWNISGKGQIHSERFAIRNSGDTACIIQLQNISCAGRHGVVIVEDAGQIYAQDEAAIYLEMAFENGEILVLTEEDQAYAVVLEPHEELAFRLTGAVNEKTSKGWEDKVLSVKLKYFSSLN